MCRIRPNLAANLRLRPDDKIKLEPLVAVSDDGEKSKSKKDRSGDLLLLAQGKPKSVVSVTLQPVEDSLHQLAAAAGGDTPDDAELQERFVAPYLEHDSGLLKQGHLLTLRDENGQQLEFYVSRLVLEGDDEEEDAASKAGGCL